MTSYHDVSFLHVSTAFREIKYKKQLFKARKKSAFCLKLTYTLFEKMYEVQEKNNNTIFDFWVWLHWVWLEGKCSSFHCKTYGGVSFVIVHSVYQAGNATERFRKNAFPKNTESLQSWSFSTRNDRKEILRCLRGNIDFKTFLVEVGFFGKSVNFRKVVYTPRMSPFGLKICERVFQTILQKNCSQDFFGWGGIFRKKQS